MPGFLRYLPTVQGRLTTGLALVVALVLGLWPDHVRDVDPLKTGAIVTAAVAWLFAELSDLKPPSAHDFKLFESISTLLPLRLLTHLRDHDYGGGFYDPGIGGLFDLSAMNGARYEFVDKTLQTRWAKVHAEIKRFSNLHAMNTWPEGGNGWFTTHPREGDRDDPKPFVQDRIDRLNEGASRLADALDGFESYARRRLNL